MIEEIKNIIRNKRVVLWTALFSVMSLTSCGDLLQQEEDTTGVLTGSWVGPTTLLTSGTQEAESTLRLTDTTFSYETNDDQTAEGTYELFGENYVRFTVEASSSGIFPEGQTVLMQLIQRGDTIELSTGEYKLILMKASESSEEIDPKVISPENAFISSACKMNVQNSGKWEFTFDKAETFTLTINGNKNFALGGMDFVGSENQVKLNITKTSISNLQDLNIIVSYAQKTTFLVSVKNQEGKEIHKGNCYAVKR
jgi:hypothetical protein